MRTILRNSIVTPDGTVMVSRYRHDYKTYTDANGLTYMVDGGNEYLRRNIYPGAPYTEASVYSGDPHELIRDAVTWGKRNKDNSIQYIKLKHMSAAHINAIIDDGYRGGIVMAMVAELDWRKSHESKSEAKRMEIQREAAYG